MLLGARSDSGIEGCENCSSGFVGNATIHDHFPSVSLDSSVAIVV